MQKDSPQIKQLNSSGYKNRSRYFINLVLLLSFSAIFIFTYSPVIQNYYFFMDDYAFVRGNSTQGYNQSLIGEMVDRSSEGRPVYGIFLFVISHVTNHVQLIRLTGILSLGLFAYIIYTILKLYHIKTDHAFLISILICTLPAFQLFVFWMVTAAYIYSAILSVTAGLLLFKNVLQENTVSFRYQAASFFISIGILVIAMCIYLPTTMLFWAVSIIPLSGLKNQDFMKKWYIRFLMYISAGFIALSVYFFSVKILHFVLNIGFPSRGGFIELSMIPLKLKWFFYCPFNYAMNLWNIFPTYKLASIIGIVIIGIFLSNILKAMKKEKIAYLLWNNCQRLLLITGILILCFLPNLLVKDSVPAYRTLVSLTTAICFLLYFGFVNLLDIFNFIPRFSVDLKDKVVTISLIILALITTYSAHNNVKNFSMIQANELSYVKNAISEYGISKLSGISEIYVRRYDENKIIERGFLYDEFGKPATAIIWGPPIITRVALQELGVKTRIKVTQGGADEPIPEGKNILAIDMTKIDLSAYYNGFITKPQSYCLTFPRRL